MVVGWPVAAIWFALSAFHVDARRTASARIIICQVGYHPYF